MKTLRFALLLFVLSGFGCAGLGLGTLKPEKGKTVKLFILSGQSNMAGRGVSSELPAKFMETSDRILMFEGGQWQPLQPFREIPERYEQRGMSGKSFGPEVGFAHAMADAWPDETIGIVKLAIGATGISSWSPNWTKEKAARTGDGGKGDLFKATLEKVRAACEARDCEIMAFLWMQGGADMKTEELSGEYLSNLKAMAEGFRKELVEPHLPFLIGSYRFGDMPDDLSNYDPKGQLFRRPYAVPVMQAHYLSEKEFPPAKMVSPRNLTFHPDGAHFDTEGLLTLGKAYADTFLEMFNAKTRR